MHYIVFKLPLSLALSGIILMVSLQSGKSAQTATNSNYINSVKAYSLNNVIRENENLDSAWKIAVKESHRLKASHKIVSSAREMVSVAKSSYFPSLIGEGAYFKLDNTPTIPFTLPSGNDMNIPLRDDLTTAAGTIEVPIYTGGRLTQNLRASKSSLSAAEFDEKKDILDVKINVADAYVKVLRARRGVEISESSVNALQSHWLNVSNYYFNQLVAKNDLLASQVSLADAQQRLLQIQNALDLANANYNRLLGRTFTNNVSIEELSVPETTNFDFEQLSTTALKTRPELAALSYESQALRHQAQAVRAEKYPQIGARGGVFWANDTIFERDYGVGAGVVAKWNIFDFGLIRHKASAIDEKAESINAIREDTTANIRLEVRQVWLEVNEASKRIGVTRKALELADENYRISQERYQNHTGTNTEVLDSETLRIRSLANYYNAVYDTVFAMLRMRRTVGDL